MDENSTFAMQFRLITERFRFVLVKNDRRIFMKILSLSERHTIISAGNAENLYWQLNKGSYLVLAISYLKLPNKISSGAYGIEGAQGCSDEQRNLHKTYCLKNSVHSRIHSVGFKIISRNFCIYYR